MGKAYSVSMAEDAATVESAQRLRYTVLTESFGIAPDTVGSGLDVDPLDEFCDHLVVQENATGMTVGTYRLLPPGRTSRLYSDEEFDLSTLSGLRGGVIEAGRACVHPAHRCGTVITLLWGALARYVLQSGQSWLAGCASVPLSDGAAAAADTWALARARHMSPPELRVRPHRPWTVLTPTRIHPSYASVPPLLRGYLRLGAWVCGAPAYDPDFRVADLFVLLSMERVDQRYLRYFVGSQQ